MESKNGQYGGRRSPGLEVLHGATAAKGSNIQFSEKSE